MKIRAPRTVKRDPLTWCLDFSRGQARCQVVEFEIASNTAPYCPLEVLFLLDDGAYDTAAPVALIVDVIGTGA
jgi:hypothetical protein